MMITAHDHVLRHDNTVTLKFSGTVFQVVSFSSFQVITLSDHVSDFKMKVVD